MCECPTCGETFDSEHAMKSHHGGKHNSPIPESGEYECSECHRAFDTKQGLRCHHTTVHDTRLTHEETSCEVCDETFSYHTERDEGRFCSQECYRDWLHNEHLTGDDSPLANQVTRECDECGQQFKRQQSRVEQNEHDYCSRECYHANHSGKNAPNWKGGGVSYYGETWLPQRRKALQRDEYECQDCGLTREQHYDEYDADLEVHHIQPIRTFKDTSEANQLSNLVTLCTECHTEHEHSDEIKLTV